MFKTKCSRNEKVAGEGCHGSDFCCCAPDDSECRFLLTSRADTDKGLNP